MSVSKVICKYLKSRRVLVVLPPIILCKKNEFDITPPQNKNYTQYLYLIQVVVCPDS